MRVVQRPHTKHRAVRSQDLPAIGVVFPALIRVLNRHVKTVGPVWISRHIYRRYVNFSSVEGGDNQHGRQSQQFVHVHPFVPAILDLSDHQNGALQSPVPPRLFAYTIR